MVWAAATFFQEQSGCEAAGIRLQEGDDYPYFEARGFPKEFVLAENSTTELLASTTEADRQNRTRNRCNGEGYESEALIPLRIGQERLGLLS